ncbi:aminodeoxychorismate synthase component I [Rhodocaloribacter litoris]|uniref:aminodeoxychorismate synthase component I n=1 Tax=Rhodocaloribacter litoris TaxID=2558931 RepID=UPI001E52CFE3|nr:aminodeoxychorismate synthase component I [Rhodocaloribacter litoris]
MLIAEAPGVPAEPGAVLLRPGTVLLDAPAPEDGPARGLLFVDPVRVLSARTPAGVHRVLAGIDAAVARGLYVAGFLSYEAGYALERAAAPPQPPAALPLAWFGVYRAPAVLGAGAVAALLDDRAPYRVSDGRFAYAPGAYARRVAAVRALIREGDVYQINLTGPYRFRFEGSARAFYAACRRRQPVRYGAWIRLAEALVLSCSPELFFERRGDLVRTRPMKGTIRRGRTADEDEALRQRLRHDEKSRAENLMIVDLLRNDLSRCCLPGSVRVPALFTIETYPTLIQMTSTVEGTLRPGTGYAGLFRALFPCGSVTGAPKLRAMQHIRTLEPGPRGVYCGAIGYAAPGDEAVFNVAIRTITLRGDAGVMGTGSGIVWDSNAEDEYAECLLKTRFLFDDDG